MFWEHLKYWIVTSLGLKRKAVDVGDMEDYTLIPFSPYQMRCICGWNRWKIKSKKHDIYECRKCGKQVTNTRKI